MKRLNAIVNFGMYEIKTPIETPPRALQKPKPSRTGTYKIK